MRCPTCHRRLARGAPCPRDGGSAPEPEARERERPVIDGFDARGPLGAGGAGTVWRALLADGTEVALKVAHDGDRSAKERFEREAAALERVGAPHAPALIASGVDARGVPWLAMELVRGETLAAWLARAPAEGAAVEESLDVIAGVAAALDAVHAAGIVHRDVKPENIVLGPSRATLVDFGLCVDVASGDSGARARISALTMDRAQIGTIAYASPEQLANAAQVDARADVYGLGAVAFELLTGRPPFVGAAAEVAIAHASSRPPSLRSLRIEAAPLDASMASALEKTPGRRYARATDLARAMRDAWSARVPAADPTSASSVTTPRHKVVALLAFRTLAPLDDLARSVAPFGGVIARVFGALSVVAFPHAPTVAQGVRAAAAAAEEARGALACEGPAIVHVAELRVRDALGSRLAGGALERPESWMPATPSDDVSLTVAASEHAFAATARRESPRPLVGRESLIAEVLFVARAALAAGRPVLVTLFGDAGIGKSALLGAIAARLSEARVVVASTVASAMASDTPALVVLDDAHRAAGEVLDAVELALLEPGPLVVVAAALPSLGTRRPEWGMRADRSHAIAIPPLDDAASRALLAACVRPAEIVPEPLVLRLVRDAEGNPQAIVDVAEAIHRSGAIRRDPGGDGFFLAADELQLMGHVPAPQLLAEVLSASLSPGLRTIAYLAAALDDALDRDTLAASALALGDDAAIDVDVAIERLARAGIFAAEGSAPRFAGNAMRRAISALTPPALRPRIDAALYQVFARAPAERPRAARHALATGDLRAARDLFAPLAEEALAAQNHADAEAHATAALATYVDAREDLGPRRALLALRARARYRVQRYADAVSDLRAALALEPTDDRELAELYLHEATARDWMHDLDGSLLAVERARGHVERVGDRRLTTQLAVATARTAWRRGEHARAAEDLELAATEAAALGDTETEIVARLMLGSALVYLGRLDAAAGAYDRVVAESERTGDRLHLAVACSNRLALWTKLRRSDRAQDDLRRALRVARELGNVQLERVASHNLAELLYLRGDLEAALPLAERSRTLQLRFFAAHPIPHDALLVARVLAALGDRGDARAALAWIDAHVAAVALTPSTRVLARMVALLVGVATDEAWDALGEEAAGVALLDEHAEVLHASVLAAARAGDLELAHRRAANARARLVDAPEWLARIDVICSRASTSGP